MPEIVDLKAREEEKRARMTGEKPQSANAPPKEETAPVSPKKNILPATLSWEAEEYVQYRKPRDWYAAVGILTIGVFVMAIILQNFLFAIFTLLAGFTIAMYGAKPPRIIRFALTGSGIEVGAKLYPYDTIKSFWIFYAPPDIKEMVIESEKTLSPRIVLPLGDMNPNEIRRYVLRFIPEEQQQESLIDAVLRYMRF